MCQEALYIAVTMFVEKNSWNFIGILTQATSCKLLTIFPHAYFTMPKFMSPVSEVVHRCSGEHCSIGPYFNFSMNKEYFSRS